MSSSGSGWETGPTPRVRSTSSTSILHTPFVVDTTKTDQGGWRAIFFFLLNPDPAGNDHSVLVKRLEAGTDILAYIPCLHALVLADSPWRPVSAATDLRAIQSAHSVDVRRSTACWMSVDNKLPRGLSVATQNGSPAAQLSQPHCCEQARQLTSSRGNTARGRPR